jgi:putative membrane protein insertion efficiency factor
MPRNPVTGVALGAIRVYQMTISRALPPSCRFIPTCSEYTFEAIKRYGMAKGVWLGAKRLSRCHPLNPGGYDPVP